MKKRFFITIMITGVFVSFLNAQIGIDKSSNLGSSAVLEFGSQARGIRLNPIENVSNMVNPSEGTIVFDGNSGSLLFRDSRGWSSPKSGGTTGGNITGTDQNTQGVIMGSTTSSAPGVLILGRDAGEARALVLPNVGTPETKMLNPPVGLLLYDSDAHVVKVWNGTTWTVF